MEKAAGDISKPRRSPAREEGRSSATPRAASPSPPMDGRCQWRCERRQLPGKSFCEAHHYRYVQNSKAGRRTKVSSGAQSLAKEDAEDKRPFSSTTQKSKAGRIKVLSGAQSLAKKDAEDKRPFSSTTQKSKAGRTKVLSGAQSLAKEDAEDKRPFSPTSQKSKAGRTKVLSGAQSPGKEDAGDERPLFSTTKKSKAGRRTKLLSGVQSPAKEDAGDERPSSSTMRGASPLLPDGRCQRNDGKDWRCGSRKLPGQSLCENHYRQYVQKSKGRGAKSSIGRDKVKGEGGESSGRAAARVRDAEGKVEGVQAGSGGVQEKRGKKGGELGEELESAAKSEPGKGIRLGKRKRRWFVLDDSSDEERLELDKMASSLELEDEALEKMKKRGRKRKEKVVMQKRPKLENPAVEKEDKMASSPELEDEALEKMKKRGRKRKEKVVMQKGPKAGKPSRGEGGQDGEFAGVGRRGSGEDEEARKEKKGEGRDAEKAKAGKPSRGEGGIPERECGVFSGFRSAQWYKADCRFRGGEY